jgi:hypothetical protein
LLGNQQLGQNHISGGTMKRLATVLLVSTAWPAYAADIAVSPLGADAQMVSIYGQIQPNDYDVFKAKAGQVSGKVSVALHGPGGNLIAALQIGEYVRLKGWGTFVLDECYSACASIWLAGSPRIMTRQAKIGFHAASLNGVEKGKGNALVGAYMNRLGLGYDAIGWATNASPNDVSLLTPANAKELGIDVNVLEPDNKQANATPTAPAQPRAIPPVPAPAQNPSLQAEAMRTVTKLIMNPSNDAETYRPFYSSPYMTYYGSLMPTDQAITKIKEFITRWPRRTYRIKSINADCRTATCTVSGVVQFQAEGYTKRSVGTASFEMLMNNYNSANTLLITAENGKALTRQTTDLTKGIDVNVIEPDSKQANAQPALPPPMEITPPATPAPQPMRDCSSISVELGMFFPWVFTDCSKQPVANPNPYGYTTVKAWDQYLTSNGRYTTRTLQLCSTCRAVPPNYPPNYYRLIAKDHDANGGSNGGSVCHFNTVVSDCETNEGVHYQLKPESIQWFLNIATGSEPGDAYPKATKPAPKAARDRQLSGR